MIRSPLLLAGALLASLALGLSFVRPVAQAPKDKPAKPAATWTIDSVHSTVLFRIRHAQCSWSYGRFADFKGTLTYDEAHPEKSSVSVDIKVASIDSFNKDRDEHLRSADFFDVAQFPDARFLSKKVAASMSGLTITGDLTLHGVTKEFTVEAEVVGSGQGMKGEALLGFHATGKLKRSDFGIKAYPEALGDEVSLTLAFECTKP